MSIRREPTYLSTDVWRAFMVLARSRSSEGKTITVDQVVDEVLRTLVEKEFPQLFEHQKQVAKLELELLKTL